MQPRRFNKTQLRYVLYYSDDMVCDSSMAKSEAKDDDPSSYTSQLPGLHNSPRCRRNFFAAPARPFGPRTKMGKLNI